MELAWRQLMAVIQKLSDCSERLIRLARQIREAAIHEQVRTVGELVIVQEQELKVFNELEQERAALVRSLERDTGQPLDSQKLLSLVPPAWSNDYRFHIEQLKQRMGDLKRENEVNGKLLRQSQQFIAWLVNCLVTPQGAGAVYDAAGSSQQKSYYHFVNQSL